MNEFDAGLMPSRSRKERLWTAFKFSSKGKHLQRFRESLSDAKQTLSLALMHQKSANFRSSTHRSHSTILT
jgi:hypothetical protein